MLLVVRVHTEVFNVTHAPYPIIAVPLFFFLSGFYDNTDKPLSVWLPKTFKRLFLVGIIWVAISFAYVSVLHYLKERTFVVNFSWESPLIGGGVTWFLFALFYAKCFTWLISQIHISKWIVLPILILTGGWISQTNLPLLLDEGIAALPFYYAGKVAYPFIKSNWNSIMGGDYWYRLYAVNANEMVSMGTCFIREQIPFVVPSLFLNDSMFFCIHTLDSPDTERPKMAGELWYPNTRYPRSTSFNVAYLCTSF